MCDRDKPQSVDELPPIALEDVVDQLLVLLTNARMYAGDHPRVAAAVGRLEQDLDAWCATTGRQELVLGTVDGYLVHDKRPLLGASMAARRLIEPLERMSAGGVAIARGARRADLLALAGVLGRGPRGPVEVEAAAHELREAGALAVRVLPPFRLAGAGSLGEAGLAALLATDHDGRSLRQLLEVDLPVKLYQRVVDHMQDVMIRACRRDRFDLAESRTLVDGMLKRFEDGGGSLLNMARYERYDAFTFGHSIRVCLMALQFARSLTDDEELLHRVGMAALLHDVGKAWLPFEILHSTTRLGFEERAEMNRHVEYGGRILLGIGADPAAVAAAFGHHRAGPRRGYPATLHPAELSTITRVVKICDVFEALTAVRPYKDSMTPSRAFRIMISMGEHFDLKLLRAFIGVHGIYPHGSRVRLTSGEVARVVSQTADLRRPRVQLVESVEGEPLDPAPDEVVDLSSDAERDRRGVERLLGTEPFSLAA
jgi:HD-GYP domain-containing protein (c-di-GMP phosphodiesterase class II)